MPKKYHANDDFIQNPYVIKSTHKGVFFGYLMREGNGVDDYTKDKTKAIQMRWREAYKKAERKTIKSIGWISSLEPA